MKRLIVIVVVFALISCATETKDKQTEIEAAQVEYTSSYTKLSEDNCLLISPENAGGGDGYKVCSGVGEYELYIYFDLYSTYMKLRKKDSAMEVDMFNKNCGAVIQYEESVEWRHANGKPFACVAHQKCYDVDEMGEVGKQTGEYYIAKGIEGFEGISIEIDATKTTDAITEVRKQTDEAHKRLK